MSTTAMAAVVFDCDGTLMDTQECVRHAIEDAFARRRLPCPQDLHRRALGLAIEPLTRLLTTTLDEEAETLQRELLAGMIARVSTCARPLPGALAVARHTAARLPTAIASNSPRALLDAVLAHGGLDLIVPVTIAADEVAAPKPAPDLYLAACAALGIDPRRALAVEDSPTGVQAARAAGMTVLGVGRHVRDEDTTHWAPALEPAHPLPGATAPRVSTAW
ncbi:HAD family hydrolase [Streptomyces sp. NPDC096013]|uniref:HAD family hydrolase n=1 Tax=Streptomyces sp. NPDC096013 TaxID=3366069 RepID=UPI00382560E0